VSAVPQGFHIGGRTADFRMRIGEHDLSHLLVSTLGPRIETVAPATGDTPALHIAWIPLIFDGDVDDPEGMTTPSQEGNRP
jgi:hypothetical protein